MEESVAPLALPDVRRGHPAKKLEGVNNGTIRPLPETMIDLEAELIALFRHAIRDGLSIDVDDPVLRSAGRPEHGHYQINGALALAPKLGRAPRDVAGDILAHIPANDVIESAEVAGPGFLNLRIRDDKLSRVLASLDLTDRASFEVEHPQVVVIDYSGPNVAKEMHVGHLRSTIIGDALARILERAGNTVIRQNHLGDWGTQFGMLLEHYDETGSAASSVRDLNQFYKRAKERFDQDAKFATRARKRVVDLQGGDPRALELWSRFVAESQRHMEDVYGVLDVLLDPTDIRGESSYNDDLAEVVKELLDQGVAQISEGAVCLFMDQFRGPDDGIIPMIVQKSDGGYNYDTTDLAAVRYRVTGLGATRLIYVVDARQALHFEMLFAAARLAGWLPENVEAIHVQFGSVLGDDGRPFKTRSGDTVRLTDLLDEAVARARTVVDASQPWLPDAERANIARAVGIGAVKFADLSSHRVRDYVFSWDRMLSLRGATAPYVQYACARLRSVIHRADLTSDPEASPIVLVTDAERNLALALSRYQRAIKNVNATLEPHTFCGYLVDLATACTTFYENCPILRAENTVKASRLALSALSAGILEDGLGLVGIRVPERM